MLKVAYTMSHTVKEFLGHLTTDILFCLQPILQSQGALRLALHLKQIEQSLVMQNL